MRRKRRKTKYSWFNIDATPVTDGVTSVNVIPFTMVATNATGSALPFTAVTGVLDDFPENILDSSSVSMADQAGSEYFIKRIVGKCFVEVRSHYNTNANIPPNVELPTFICCAGLFVAPCDTADRTLVLGGNSPDLASEVYDPLNFVSGTEPWIWRRSWILTAGGHEQQADTSGNRETGTIIPIVTHEFGLSSWPNTNARYGSVMDGPHVDAKTGRRVRKHERLWAATTFMTYPPTSTVSNTNFGSSDLLVTWDLRVLGALRRAHNRSSFE